LGEICYSSPGFDFALQKKKKKKEEKVEEEEEEEEEEIEKMPDGCCGTYRRLYIFREPLRKLKNRNYGLASSKSAAQRISGPYLIVPYRQGDGRRSLITRGMEKVNYQAQFLSALSSLPVFSSVCCRDLD
jgi:hypothetical protein